MSSIEEIRAGIAAMCGHCNSGLSAMAQAKSDLEQARSALMRASDGTEHNDPPAIVAALTAAIEDLERLQGTTNAAGSSAEDWGARL